ncbi:barstar family protein [Pseudonocardia sp. WMMC193]|uniref:barstar family protein n=1 Tax=Pseudonocardia sp. WMMC193 TaxID=2911965 RepID=UPI001F2AB50C|nr:barstar family protein [Pseudonocardia sp. WMMC193]MCF7551249.1 barstar family protein [Pseudonocardia sp. WMMC193]
MTRRLLFDPTDRETFVRQWQRFDYQLLQSGFVHRVPDVEALRRAGRLLGGAGYLVHELDAVSWSTDDDLHAAFATALGFPGYYGRNFDALNDVLGDIARFEYGSDPASTGTVVLIDNYDQVHAYSSRTASVVADIFARGAAYGAVLGHPMLLLLHCTADLGELGGRRARSNPVALQA